MDEKQIEQIRKDVESCSEEEFLDMVYEILTRYRVKSDTIVNNLESGRVIFAHQKLKGHINGLDHLRGRIAMRLEYLSEDENETNQND